ncbi:MAG: alpha-glucan family phosphorylase [Candidatus Marinimicrobia bacterium]|nr:alpha-glucan family phosphorylase [Candidatus Neomarinimicrobiota bacterium]
MSNNQATIAYFSAEIGISPSVHTYSGGLGILAGDHIKAAADLGVNMVALTLMYKEGYFKQRMDEEGNQTEVYPRFEPEPFLDRLPVMVSLPLRGHDVQIQAWKYTFTGIRGNNIDVLFLDTDIPENTEEDRDITLRLYAGGKDHRILQEAILGFGGIRILRQLGYKDFSTYHMNEGHCSFLTLELLKEFAGNEEEVRKRCHFTTHTPVSAGHDHFASERVSKLIGDLLPNDLKLPSMVLNSRVHMTELGLYYSRSANGVSALHGQVARDQFPEFKIGHVTNGVFHRYWVGKIFREVYDRNLPGWREDPTRLLEIDSIPAEELLFARRGQKKFLLDYANSQSQRALSPRILTIGFARRAAEYKRARLIFHDKERLIRMAKGNKIQFVFAGKAHPRDDHGKEILKDIVIQAKELQGEVKIVFLENYNMWLGNLITSGVDVWLNTPLRPNEASGTSGMKATLNGVPNLSIMDGWWAEGCNHGVNGWAIGDPNNANDAADADHLYRLLEEEIIPTFYNDQRKWISIIREAIKTGVQFTGTRMVQDYLREYYK